MWDHIPSRPGSRAGNFTSTFTAAGALHSHSTSISSFADLSASSTNIYSSHTRRVRSVRKLRQILGPDEEEGNVERMDNSTHRELPPPSPLIIPTDNEPTMSLPTPYSDTASDDEEEKALSLVYARRIKLEKLKRRFGEDVPRELIFFDQVGPSSPTLSTRGRSMSSPNVMTFAESEAQSRGHTKNLSISTINPANVPTMALKRSKAMLRLWTTSKSRSVSYNKLSEADIVEEDPEVETGLNAEDETQLTSLEGSSTCGDYSKATEISLDEISSSDHDSIVPQLDVVAKSSSENTSGIQIVRSRSTLVINRTSEDDEQPHFSTLVESSNKSVIFSMKKSPNVTERASDSLTSRRSHDDTLGNNLSNPGNMRGPRKARSAVALASENRIQATTPPLTLSPSAGKQSWEHSAPSTPSTSSTPSPTLRSSHPRHDKNGSWNDDGLGISEDDRQTGRFTHRTSRPKGPRPSSRSRPRTADGTVASKATSDEFRHSDEAVEHWQQLSRQKKLVHNDSGPDGLISFSSNSYSLPTRRSIPPPPLPSKSPKHSKFKMSVSHEESSSFSSVTSAPPAPQKTSSKNTATAIYFYHRGVVRLAVEDGARGPKTVQTVYMRDVLNYLREMRYVH